MSADFTDVNGAGYAKKGDRITLKFSAGVTLSSTDAAAEIANLRQGDTFGQGATIAMGATNDTVVVTLGEDPYLRMTGTYSSPTGKSSGLTLAPAGSLASNGATAPAAGLDIGCTLAPAFKAAAALNVSRGLHSSTLLADGRVLIVGGLNSAAGTQKFVAENEIYDPKTDTFTKLSDPALGGTKGYMLFAAGQPAKAYPIVRISHTATLLLNGQVLIVGGYGVEGLDSQGKAIVGDLTSAFLFDPAKNSFAFVGLLNVARRDHYAQLLANGDVLIAGGFNGKANQGKGSTLPVAEIWDHATGKFNLLSTTGMDMISPREQGASAPIAGGVLFTGGTAYVTLKGQTAPALYKAPGSEAFDAQAKKFVNGPKLVEQRRWHTATTFLSGNVLIAGGDDQGAKTSVEKFMASSAKFVKVGDLKEARSRHVAARMLGTADVILAGGIAIDYTAKKINPVKTGEWWDGNANVSEAYPMTIDRNGSRATPLLDGRVLVSGGFSGGATSVLGLDGSSVDKCEAFTIP